MRQNQPYVSPEDKREKRILLLCQFRLALLACLFVFIIFRFDSIVERLDSKKAESDTSDVIIMSDVSGNYQEVILDRSYCDGTDAVYVYVSEKTGEIVHRDIVSDGCQSVSDDFLEPYILQNDTIGFIHHSAVFGGIDTVITSQLSMTIETDINGLDSITIIKSDGTIEDIIIEEPLHQ